MIGLYLREEIMTKANLYTKFLTVQKELKALTKTGRNDFHKYDYTTASDVLEPTRETCNQAGLILFSEVIEQQIEPGRASVVIKLTVADAETGEIIEVQAPGYGEDWNHKDNRPTGDKAVYKAITGGLKYAVKILFCLPSVDDPERENTPRKPFRTRETREISKEEWLARQNRN